MISKGFEMNWTKSSLFLLCDMQPSALIHASGSGKGQCDDVSAGPRGVSCRFVDHCGQG